MSKLQHMVLMMGAPALVAGIQVESAVPLLTKKTEQHPVSTSPTDVDPKDTNVRMYITAARDGSKGVMVNFEGFGNVPIPWSEIDRWEKKYNVKIPTIIERIEKIKQENGEYHVKQVELDQQACDELQKLDERACVALKYTPEKLGLGEHSWNKLPDVVNPWDNNYKWHKKQVYRELADTIIHEGQERVMAVDFKLKVDAQKAEELKSTSMRLGEKAAHIKMPKDMRKRDQLVLPSFPRATAKWRKGQQKSERLAINQGNRILRKRSQQRKIAGKMSQYHNYVSQYLR